MKCKVISLFWYLVKAIFNAVSLYMQSPEDVMLQVAHPFSLHFKPFTSAMFSEGLLLVSLCSNCRRNSVVDYFWLHFHIISLSDFNTILWIVHLLYSFSCYETLQFLLFLLGRKQTQILWKRVSNKRLCKWFILAYWLMIITEKVSGVHSVLFVSSACFTAVCLTIRSLLQCHHFSLPKITAAISDGYHWVLL